MTLHRSSSKYRNIRTEYNGRMFASRKEAAHAQLLDVMRRARDPSQQVVDVQYQYRMPLLVNNIKVATYVADFYVTYGDGRKEIHDTKGMLTAMYKLKKKMVEAQYGERILEF